MNKRQKACLYSCESELEFTETEDESVVNIKSTRSDFSETFLRSPDTRDRKIVETNNELYEDNKKILFNILNGYFFWCDSQTKEELAQEGFIALMKAKRKFDYTMGYKFSNYVHSTIEKSMKRYLDNNLTTVREFVHIRQERHKMNKLSKEYGRPPSLDEVREKLGVCKKTAKRIMEDFEQQYTFVSFDEEIGEDGGVTLYDFYKDETYMPDKSISDINAIQKQLAVCREVIYRGFPNSNKEQFWNVFLKTVGLDKNGEHTDAITYGEIGKKYGVSKQRIEQIYKRISDKLKKELDIDFNVSSLA